MPLGKRIAETLDELGWQQKELSDKSGVDEGTISALITRDSMRSQFAAPLAEGLGIQLLWLLTGEGEKWLTPNASANYAAPSFSRSSGYNVAEPVAPVRARLPKISWVSAGMKDHAHDPYLPGAADEWIEFESHFSKTAFCLVVRGDSMVRPDGTGFPEGSIIGVEPNRVAKAGDFVIVRFESSDEATFKQYIIDGPMKMLKPLNPRYMMMQLPPDGYVAGVVIEKIMREKF